MTIIAEIGQNFHNIKEARRMITLARENGADLVKFQLFDSVKLYGEKIPQELTFGQTKMLFDYGVDEEMEVFFSVFDTERVAWCEDIGVKRYKIATMYKSRGVMQAVKDTGKPVIISWFYDHNFWHIEMRRVFGNDAKVLHCVPEYPTGICQSGCWLVPFRKARDTDRVYDGYSDHAVGIEACKIAIMRGAGIIEKHFTLGNGVDKEWSMTPSELKELSEFYKQNNKE